MNTLHNILFLFFCSISGFSKAEDIERFDVIAWFDGCNALEQSGYSTLVETVCINAAYDFCQLGNSEPINESCLLNLAQHISSRSTELRAELPNDPELPVFKKNVYHNRLSAFDDELLKSCDEVDESGALCELSQHFPRWQELRMAKRILSE